MDATGDVEKTPSIGISYTIELPNKRALVLQSFIERDASVQAVDLLLDKIREAGERQFAFGMLEVLKLDLEQQTKLAQDHAYRMQVVEDNLKKEWAGKGKSGAPKLSQNTEAQKQAALANLEISKQRITKVEADIAHYKALTDRTKQE